MTEPDGIYNPSFVARFWDCVSISPGCWLWSGPRYPNGYGQIHWGTREERGTFIATRVMVAYATGTYPEPYEQVMHSCDNPPCCNPNHLTVGTPAENAQDMVRKGRYGVKKPRGFDSKLCKLGRAQVSSIREAFTGGKSRASLAREYSVSWPLIERVLTLPQYGPMYDEC